MTSLELTSRQPYRRLLLVWKITRGRELIPYKIAGQKGLLLL